MKWLINIAKLAYEHRKKIYFAYQILKPAYKTYLKPRIDNGIKAAKRFWNSKTRHRNKLCSDIQVRDNKEVSE